jgi:hypothetical protein
MGVFGSPRVIEGYVIRLWFKGVINTKILTSGTVNNV